MGSAFKPRSLHVLSQQPRFPLLLTPHAATSESCETQQSCPSPSFLTLFSGSLVTSVDVLGLALETLQDLAAADPQTVAIPHFLFSPGSDNLCILNPQKAYPRAQALGPEGLDSNPASITCQLCGHLSESQLPHL